MALNWLRRSKHEESKAKPTKQPKALLLEISRLKHKVAEITKKNEENSHIILRLREESSKARVQNENLKNEKEVLKKTIKKLEQQLKRLKKKRARSFQKVT